MPQIIDINSINLGNRNRSNNYKWTSAVIAYITNEKNQSHNKCFFFADAELQEMGANTTAKQWNANGRRYMQEYIDRICKDDVSTHTYKCRRHTMPNGTKGLIIGSVKKDNETKSKVK